MTLLNKDLLGFTRKDNTLSRKIKDSELDRIELEIGDSKTPNGFIPQAKIMRWDNEVNLSLRRVKPKPTLVPGSERATSLLTPSVDIKGDRVIYEDENEEVHIYEKPEIGEDGGLEIEIHLKERPPTNRFEFSIHTKGLVFYYQPEITEREKSKKIIAKGGGRLRPAPSQIRPDNVVGSYAVYHATKKNNISGDKEYKTGKFCHIYRPHVTDSHGNEVWGKLEIDELAGILTVVVPQEFLDTAIYPVIVDPTLGYTTIGASSEFDGYDSRMSTQFTSGSDSGNIESITAYSSVFETSGAAYRYAVYNTSDFSKLAQTPVQTVVADGLGTDFAWRTIDTETNPTILSSTDYTITMGLNANMDWVRYDVGAANQSAFVPSVYVAGSNFTDIPLPNTLADTFNQSRIYSIYATFGSASAESPVKVKVAGAFQDSLSKVKVAGTFVEKTPQIKQGGTFS